MQPYNPQELQLEEARENENLTLTQKYQYVIEHLKQVDSLYVQALEGIDKMNLSIVDEVKIQTFYRSLKPALENFSLNLAYNEVFYPLSSVIAFPHPQLQYHQVGMNFTMWVQSGGLRCLPITPNQELSSALVSTHCMIVPDCFRSDSTSINLIKSILHETRKFPEYPVLFCGLSSLIALEILAEKPLEFESCPESIACETYMSYQGIFGQQLNISLRLAVENRKKVNAPSFRISLEEIQSIPDLSISGFVCLNKKHYCLACQLKHQPIFFLFYDAWTFNNNQSIGLAHKLINNFSNLAKKHPKTVKQKHIKLLGEYKLVHKGQNNLSSHYKVGK